MLFKLSFPRIRRPTPYGSLLFTVVSVKTFAHFRNCFGSERLADAFRHTQKDTRKFNFTDESLRNDPIAKSAPASPKWWRPGWTQRLRPGRQGDSLSGRLMHQAS